MREWWGKKKAVEEKFNPTSIAAQDQSCCKHHLSARSGGGKGNLSICFSKDSGSSLS